MCLECVGCGDIDVATSGNHYHQEVVRCTKAASMPVASWEALQEQLKLLNSLPEIDQKLTELHVAQFAGRGGRPIRPVRGDL